jgi:uncharacterized protein YjbI with pentapeptide repeats
MNESDLSDANLSNTRLIQAQLGNALCERTLFCGADLTYADLSNARLKDADFSNTSLYRSNLHGIADDNAIWSGASKSLALGMDAKRLKAETWTPKPRTGD